ncbi:MAG: hypothetical protein ACREMK_05755 [Gemmatimonadota bacterium]
MKKLSTITIATALVLTACGARTDSQVATTTEMGTVGERVGPYEDARPLLAWEAAIVADPGFDLAGEASVRDLTEGRTRIAVEIRAAEEGTTLPWHLHRGDCVTGGDIVGDPAAYPPLAVNADGEATADATIDETLDPDSDVDYHINIHKSPSELDTIIACGELQEN